MIKLPQPVAAIIRQLNTAGFQAYIVGGCIRDSLYGSTPVDWDICTSAKPSETKACFLGNHLIETGLKHGTVTVRVENQFYEITTMRCDGEYKDYRRPDQVTYVTDIRQDLARRDFTVNAMAYHPVIGLIDCFGGQEDLRQGILRCVGDATDRFREDPLRIMRALRFAAVYGFEMDKKTRNAMFDCFELMQHVSAERICEEMKKLLVGEYAVRVLKDYVPLLTGWIPELAPMFGMDQKSSHHCYDVWSHTLAALQNTPPEILLRLAIFLHDVGKPLSFSVDDRGNGHFYGHEKIGATLSENILRRLKFDYQTIAAVKELIAWHMHRIEPTEKSVKRCLNQLGELQFSRLLQVIKADRQATAHPEEGIQNLTEIKAIYQKIIKEKDCFSLKQLAVSGDDIKQLGVQEGKPLGDLLRLLLKKVMDGSLPNEKAPLLTYAKKYMKKS